MTPEQKAAIIYFKADVITANELLAVGEVWTQPVSESGSRHSRRPVWRAGRLCLHFFRQENFRQHQRYLSVITSETYRGETLASVTRGV